MGSSAGRWAPGPGWALRPDRQPDSVAGLADKVQRLIGVFVSRYQSASKMILIRGFEYVIQSLNTTHRWTQKLTDTPTPFPYQKKNKTVCRYYVYTHTCRHTLLDSVICFCSLFLTVHLHISPWTHTEEFIYQWFTVP